MYEIIATVIASEKMKAKYVNWSLTRNIEATSPLKAITVFLNKEVKPLTKADKNLKYAIRKGGLNIKAALIGRQDNGKNVNKRNKKAA